MTLILSYRAVVLLWCFWFPAIPIGIQQAANDLSTPLDIQVEVVQPTEGMQTFPVLVTLRNRSNSGPVTKIKLLLGKNEPDNSATDLQILQSGQSWSTILNVSTNLGGSYLIISFELNNLRNSAARAINLPVSPASTLVPTILSALFSFLGVLIGALLLHWLTSMRDRDSFNREWAKEEYGKSAQVYRKFLNDWREDTSGDILREHFAQLKANSNLPPTVITTYNETYAILSDQTKTNLEKQQAAQKLRQTFDNFMLHPGAFISIGKK